MLTPLQLIIIGTARPVVILETWSDVATILVLEEILRLNVDQLKGKQFNTFKANIPFAEVPEIPLSNIADSRFRRLEWDDLLAELWPNGFDPLLIHLVVELVQAIIPPPSDLQSVTEAVRDLARVQAAAIQYLNGQESPSLAAKPSYISFIQGGEHPIRNGRPLTVAGRPIALYHRVFDEFKDAAARPPTIEYLNDTSAKMPRFIDHPRAIYKHEDDRFRTLAPDIGHFLGFHLSQEKVCISDRVVVRNAGGCLLVSEWKNEVGTGGCDPSVQAAFSYCRYWGQDNMNLLRESCCCPSFILAVAGPWMCVLGAIFLEEPIVEPLTDFVWIGPRDCLSDGTEGVARVFQALGAGLSSLDSFYDNLTQGESQAHFYPWVTHFLDRDSQKIDFRYAVALGGEHYHRKAVFKARTSEPNPWAIVVKFTRRYNGQAHKLLAAHGFAPELLFDGSEHPDFPRPASLLMMVMEFVVEAPKGPTHDEAYPTLRAALDLLHAQGLVFGDLRLLNVLVPKHPTNEEAKAMLIDFDWCGKDGEDRYPWGINTDIAWADGVGPGTLMHKRHDDFMLEQIRS